MTNGDKIRKMTDEEIAENILLHSDYFTCKECPYKLGCEGKKCEDAAIEWLRREADEDAAN